MGPRIHPACRQGLAIAPRLTGSLPVTAARATRQWFLCSRPKRPRSRLRFPERNKDKPMLQIVKPASPGKSRQSLEGMGLHEADLEASLSLSRYDEPRRPFGWACEPGSALRVGPITDATTHHLPPFADEALSARIRRLTGPEARAEERSDLMTIAIALSACLFIAVLGGSALVGAALRLPAIEKHLAQDART